MFNAFVCFIRFYDAAFATALNQGLPNHAWWHDVHVNVRSLVSVEGCVQEVLPSVGTVTYHKDEAQHPIKRQVNILRQIAGWIPSPTAI